MSETIYGCNFAKYLPQPLTHDKKMIALANVAEKELLNISGLAKTVLIYPRIDELPEELIDILAYDMHVDWYNYSFPLKVKRDILKGSVKVHKKMGTKFAVETVLKGIHKGAKVEEWFDYGGKPYFFRVSIDIGTIGLSKESIYEIINELKLYQNIRSHCEKIRYNICPEKSNVNIGAFYGCGEKLKIKALLADNIKATANEKMKTYQRSNQIITIKQKRG